MGTNDYGGLISTSQRVQLDLALGGGGGILMLVPSVDFIADCCVLGMSNKLAQC